MPRLRKLVNFKSIQTKMLLGFSVIILLVVMLIGFNLYVLKHVNQTTSNVLHKELPLLIADEELVSLMHERMGAVRAYVISGDASYKEQFNQATEEAMHQQEKIEKLASNSEAYTDLLQGTVEWRDFVISDVFNVYDQGNKELAMENLLKADEYVGPLANGYQELAENREAHIISLEENILSDGKQTINFDIIISVVVVLSGVIIAIITSRALTKPVRVLNERMGLIAKGDLSAPPIQTHLRDEIGELISSTNEMNHTMRNLLNRINEASETVSSQSEELTQSTNEVKAGTEQISITMEELASGSEVQANHASDLTETMGLFARRIEQASQGGEGVQTASTQVLDMTNEGAVLMHSSMEQMKVIDEIVHHAVERVKGFDHQAKQITELVSVIREIAEQTNLLALNAAIEAARAGEHGKGFAVVADEVRKLAEQSSVSVQDISQIVNDIQSESSSVALLLQDSYDEVEEGTAQITATGDTFSHINTAMTDMTTHIKQVSTVLSEVVASTQEINTSIQEIAAVSEESAAGVEETSASSQQASSAMEEVASSSSGLAGLAEELNGLVRQFKL